MSASPPPNPDPAAPGRGWDPKVIFSVVAICFLFFVLSYYRILERIFFPRNHQVLRQPPYEANFEDPSFQYQSHGLDLPTLQSLPITQFRKKVIDEEEQQPRPSSMECAICLGEFDEGEWLKHLPSCKHVFHFSCIDAWFQDHSNCPLCRTLVYGCYDSRSVCSESPSVSSHPLLEPLRREDFSRERQTHYQTVRSEILQNIDVRPSEPVAGNHPSS